MAVSRWSLLLASIICVILPFRPCTSTNYPAPSVTAAIDAVRARGYSIFSAILENTPRNNWNYTGTVLAPSDGVFFSIAEKFKIPPMFLSHPSISFILYHTISKPLSWQNLASVPNGSPLPTLYQNRCLFIRQESGDTQITGGTLPSSKSIKIIQPDLYLSGDLAIHGTDGILDESLGAPCGDASIKNSLYLDHAARDLRRRGYSVVALALKMRRIELAPFTAATLFAPPDESLLAGADGFLYDVRYHIIPRRLTYEELATLPCGSVIETILEGRVMVVGRANGAGISINGLEIKPEIYRNGWLAVFSIPHPLKERERMEAGFLQDCVVLSDIGKLPDVAVPVPTPAPAVVSPPVSTTVDVCETVVRYFPAAMGAPVPSGSSMPPRGYVYEVDDICSVLSSVLDATQPLPNSNSAPSPTPVSSVQSPILMREL